MIDQPGIYTMPGDEYHADPCIEPSLSASLAAVLVGTTPLHAWARHPRLNEHFERVEEEKFDIGNLAHSIVLEGNADKLHLVDAKDWRTKAAQEERDQARADGKIPLLEKDFERVRVAGEAIRIQLMARDDDPPIFSDGKAEQTLIWQERGIWIRARLDWLRDDYLAIDDLKTTARSANPLVWGNKTAFNIGADIQVALYRRGVKALTGIDPFFRYVIAESVPPFAIGVVSLGASALELGEAKVERAIELWRRCTRDNNWPGYPTGVYMADAPAWAELQWMEQDAEVVLS